MDNTYFHRQTAGKPLFSDVIWSQPEQQSTAGKLAIIGGSGHGFYAVSRSYADASKTGIGSIRVLLPDVLKRTVSYLLPESEFAPSTKSGSLARSSLSILVELAAWADGVLFPGDLGKSSETAILMEHYLEKNTSLLSLAGDAISIIYDSPSLILDNDHLCLILDFNQLQKLLLNIRFPMAARSQMTIYQMAELLHALTLGYPWSVITEHENLFFVAYGGKVSATSKEDYTLAAAGVAASVWRLQQPTKTFEAESSGLYVLTNGAVA
ncbi:hypothetical protein M1512_00525 [Patescibacteria group bacterium]|nr:hypothetical protein [Patescibacteria group bacterium]